MATAKTPAVKKTATKAKVETYVEAEPEVLTTIQPQKQTKTKQANDWVFKDRLYELASGKEPLVYTVPTMHSIKSPLLHFDKELGYQREIRYATNQRSPFVDEQEGAVTLGRIVLRNGILRVPKENVSLQKFLAVHPFVTSGVITEYKPDVIAEYEIDWIEMEMDALNSARDMDVDQAEGILRVQSGSKVAELSSKELKRDLLIFARKQPRLFLELANDDNVQLRNIGIKATEQGILRLSSDNRTFMYGETDRKIMTVPFDEHPYSALAAYFKTDEGMEVLNVIEKRL